MLHFTALSRTVLQILYHDEAGRQALWGIYTI